MIAGNEILRKSEGKEGEREGREKSGESFRLKKDPKLSLSFEKSTTFDKKTLDFLLENRVNRFPVYLKVEGPRKEEGCLYTSDTTNTRASIQNGQ